MARHRTHVRVVLLGAAVTGALTAVWALAFLLAAGRLPFAVLVLGPAAGILTALAAARLSGHPARHPRSDAPPAATDNRLAVPVGSGR
ncbi:MAG TPA: hypothetical protein VFB74_05855 [Kribbellaceae bacterium]|nr:hypothetical protein [Kribbellaceae bacterium]